MRYTVLAIFSPKDKKIASTRTHAGSAQPIYYMKKMLAAVLVAILLPYYVQGQGCSDAGFCTAGTLHSDPSNAPTDEQPEGMTEQDYSVGLAYTLGMGEQGTLIQGIQAEANVRVGIAQFQAKLPFVFASGNLGSHSGIGDLILTASLRAFANDAWKVNVNVGLRAGIGGTDAVAANGLALPMPYQTGLGTYDAIGGVSVNYKKWLFATGVQIPVAQNNKNTFYPGLWAGSADSLDAAPYFASAALVRAGDMLLRLDRQFNVGSKIALSASVLSIFHLQKDKVTLPGGAESRVPNSSGVTLNLAGGFHYAPQPHWRINLLAGFPVLVRENRPDGLTRSLALTTGVEYRF